MRGRFSLVASLLWVLGLGGAACAPGRLADLCDVAELSVGSGRGFSVDATLGALSQPSLGFYGAKTVAFGVEGRDVEGFIVDSSLTFPYSVVYALEQGSGFFEALNFTGWHTSYAVTALQRGFEEADRPLEPRAPREFQQRIGGHFYGGATRGGRWLPLRSAADRFSPRLRFGDLTRFELGGHLGIGAVRVGVNPLELIDFLLGFAGLDIAGDDGPRTSAYTPLAAPGRSAYTARVQQSGRAAYTALAQPAGGAGRSNR
jgi:hypothetical protein